MRDGSVETLVQEARKLLSRVAGQPLPLSELVTPAVELTRLLLQLGERHTTERDREQFAVLSRMMDDERGQIFTTTLTDRAYRSNSKRRAVEQARYLLEKIGAPEYVGPLERIGLRALRDVGTWLPTLSGTAMLNRIQDETSAFILPAGRPFDAYLARQRQEGVWVNVNHLGEEVLGEREALRRVDDYVRLLAHPGVEIISVKVSSIFSQANPLGFERVVDTVSERLATIYRAAIEQRCASGEPKLVMLDMEAYRDLHVTLAALKRVLAAPEFHAARGGVALQAYLPEASTLYADLVDWAAARRAAGGAPFRIRVVKGANLAMETIDSAMRGWPCPIYPSKAEVDANFKRVLSLACEPRSVAAVDLGIASHNLFDVALGMLLRASRAVEAQVSFELLEGMANPLLRSLRRLGANVMVYAPFVAEHEFPSAIAYLVRRLDENTSAENYLRHSFAMRAGSEAFSSQEQRFRKACSEAGQVSVSPRRNQDRAQSPSAPSADAPFSNEADTDFSLAANRAALADWLQRTQAGRFTVRSRIGGREIHSGQERRGTDPSRPGYDPYRIELASRDDIEAALSCAALAHREDPVALAATTAARRGWLLAAAQRLREARCELISLMVLDAGKRAEEADVEVSEAIDFAEYYARCHAELEGISGSVWHARGPVVVTPPWNFPLAIPLGGVFAALVAGNPVIFKPALETPLVARRACELLWQAGVPEQLLQFVVCRDEVASALITDARTQLVVLTGATSTARLFLDLRPGLQLLAETGGKNALFISAMSDHEQAIADAVASAFGHAGQKCSALSQLILERELYEDPGFLATLADATRSLKVGSAWQPDTFVTPLIAPPSQHQLEALTTLAPGESWLVQPEFDAANPHLVSPGIKLGVRPGSASHTTEYFCPLLGVLSANDVADAARIANSTKYGLTAGIHSLDEREQDLFIDAIDAGNVYVNRRITGAIVQRQPFGGWKESNFGPGAKAGGPNYVAQFARVRSNGAARGASGSAAVTLPSPIAAWLETISTSHAELRVELTMLAREYVREHTRWFASGHDATGLVGEDNVLRYRPLIGVAVVMNGDSPLRDVVRVALAAQVVGCPLHVLALGPQRAAFGALGPVWVADEGALLSALDGLAVERVRCLCPPTDALYRMSHRNGWHVEVEAASPFGRIELPRYLREQAVSVLYHRYGHLGLRAGSTRQRQ